MISSPWSLKGRINCVLVHPGSLYQVADRSMRDGSNPQSMLLNASVLYAILCS